PHAHSVSFPPRRSSELPGVATGGERSSASCGSSATARSPTSLLFDEPGLDHQALVQRVVLLEKRHHVLAGEEDGLERLLFHVLRSEEHTSELQSPDHLV